MEHLKAHFYISWTRISSPALTPDHALHAMPPYSSFYVRDDQLASSNPSTVFFSSNASSDNEARLIFREIKRDNT